VSLSRALATFALVLAVAILAWLLLLRGSPGHEYTFVFENAGQLVRDNDVQVGGRRVGSIKDIELTDDNQAAAPSRARSRSRRCARAPRPRSG
jgi:phospholipid/cholesterol/gamma-HCH transport system substrate-binding protein